MSFVQSIFNDYRQPFAITYLGASLMVVYLPISFIKDWLCGVFRKSSRGSSRNVELPRKSSGILDSPLNYVEMQKTLEMELQSSLARKDSEPDLSSQEEGVPFIAKRKDEVDTVRTKREFTTKEIAMYGLYLAPIWFMTEVRLLISIPNIFSILSFQIE